MTIGVPDCERKTTTFYPSCAFKHVFDNFCLLEEFHDEELASSAYSSLLKGADNFAIKLDLLRIIELLLEIYYELIVFSYVSIFWITRNKILLN
jgi:hypothetical protein